MTQHENHGEHHGSLKAYVIGFILSIILTIIPLVLVMNHILTGTALVFTIMAMAVAQLLVQLFFFMHIREGDKPRYNVQALILGVVIVFTIVAGSMWIMTFNSQVQ
ncbi:cytochrome o ubiquinol oxidase subunit IV [Brevibacillus ruminantium]|uniref:Cytochrome o ubiquinol oxidase subunit IV n=1 Tax=Brevibacillus ruminantium TaxID=2950604 RepID=A0ABY4WIT5_9BACL|nr:cytochrome o ubiquinol oxidase subunit IV [Brevibacillus ruminantium]USG64556.1 cytochrome o ubiquinol oxidase subunit IV [Brevibacillus ruminantium]